MAWRPITWTSCSVHGSGNNRGHQGGCTQAKFGSAFGANPDTFVGVDLAYISADLAAKTAKDAKFIDGIPILAIEILSPSDTVEDIAEKVREYLDAGVSLVWEVNPIYEGVTVHRPGVPYETFNVTQELIAEPHLPGFRIPVAEIFAM